MLNQRIKEQLNIIIDTAYRDKDESERKRYKAFTINILTKELKQSSGAYYPQKQKIEIYNASLGTAHLAKCCIHELAHHIDKMQHGSCCGHQPPFYGIYKRLVFGALDSGILKKEDFDDDWSSDRNKVKRMLEDYVPHKVIPDKTKSVIKIYNGFQHKDKLKELGFRWNKIEQIWEKTAEDGDTDKIKGIGIFQSSEDDPQTRKAYYVVSDPNMYIDPIIYIEANGQTYQCKDVLKEYKFFFDEKKKKWKKKIKAKDSQKLLSALTLDPRLMDCSFAIINRKSTDPPPKR